MDVYEATRVVFSRIQALDPDNTAKIMGLLLIQDHGDKEMIRLAFGPEVLIHSVVLKARKELGLVPSSWAPPPPFSRTNSCNGNRSATMNGGADDLTNHDELVSPFYGGDLIDDLQLSFLDDHTQNRPKRDDLFYPDAAGDCRSPSAIGDGGLYNYSMGWGANGHYRRSFSVADLCLSSEAAGSGLGWKPCLYFAKGYCKNGSSCRFLHDLPDDSKMDAMVEQQCHELLLRSKSQRFGGASQLMPPSPSSTTNSMNFLLQHQNDTQRAAGFMGRPRMERIDFAGMMNPGSRQIYLTFPADSTFREEDVSNYFSIYGPVQDVRIPYQQKRMFGFVTFLYPETVKLILAKGNPHFVCDARVLVKPYKEKGRVPDKYRKQQQQLAERRDFSGCTTPTGLDSRDPYDLGSRMLYSSSCKDVLLRRKIEEQQQAAELQQAIELQGRQFMGLQLLDLKKRALTSPNADHIYTTSSSSSSSSEQSSPGDKSPSPAAATTALPFSQAADRCVGNGSPHGLVQQAPVNGAVADKEESTGEVSPHDDTGFKKSADYNLPDSPFASPTRASFVAAADTFSTATPVAEAHESIPASPYANSNNHHLVAAAAAAAAALLPATDMAPFKSCFLQIPRFSSGHEAVGM